MQATHILGIDISKDKFDVCLRAAAPEGARHAATFPNHAKGFQALNRWLAKHPVTQLHACLEATSRYGDALALHLHQHGHTVSLVNPRRTRHYADSRLVHTQNDTIDAALIADFCASQNPRPWQPVAAAMRKLVRLIYGVLKQGQPFDPNWENRGRAVGLGGRASDGDEPSSHPLASPSVATA